MHNYVDLQFFPSVQSPYYRNIYNFKLITLLKADGPNCFEIIR